MRIPAVPAWTPAALGAALLVDLDADDCVTSVGKVVSLADRLNWSNLTDSGNAPQRPTYNASGPNGHAEMTFDGIAQHLDGSVHAAQAVPFTIVYVYKRAANVGNGYIFSDGAANAMGYDTALSMNFFGGAANNVVVGAPPNVGAYGVMMFEKNGTSTDWYNNGTKLTDDNTSPGTSAFDRVILGCYQPFPASSSFMAITYTKFMLIAGIMSGTDRGLLQTYLKNRYGTP